MKEVLTMYKILCEVSGGITGHRTAYLKKRGAEVSFATEAQAQEQANELAKFANDNRYKTANYRYTVEKMQ